VSILLARVDNRLVHGQVLEVWVPRLRAEAIVAVDRALAGDPFQRRLVEGLSRAGVEVTVATPEEAAALVCGALKGRKLLLLFADLRQALETCRAGVELRELNLGNLHPRPGSRALTTTVYLTAEDVECLAALQSAGVEVEARALPTDKSPDVWAKLAAAPGEPS
jgi:PTS system mannose-specific IIB component